MCCVVTVYTLYRVLNRTSRSAALPYPEHGTHSEPLHIYLSIFFATGQGFGHEFLGAVSVLDSRNWNSRFVRAPFSVGGSNASCSSSSVPQLAEIAMCADRDNREVSNFLYSGQYTPDLF